MLEPTASVSIRQSLLLPEAVPDLEKVGKFDDDKVEEPENNIHHDQEGSSWNNFTNFFKNVKYNILGVTVKASIVWAIVYVIAIIINLVGDTYTSSCENEQLWTIGPGLTLVNHHHKDLKYGWGLEENGTNSGLFYIKDKAKCKPITWYPGPKIQTPKIQTPKIQTPKTTTPKTTTSKNKITQNKDLKTTGRTKRAIVAQCPTQAFMGHEIKPVEFLKTDPHQKWKLDQYDINGKLNKTSKFFKLCLVPEPEANKTCVSATKNPNEFESKQDCSGIIASNVENFRTFEGNTRKVISVLLGFFVATIVKRWWDQTSKIPRLDKLAISLNAIMQEEGKGPESMKKVKHEILRLAALSYAIVMISISGEFADKPEAVIEFLKDKKGLLKDEEIKTLGFTDDQLKEKKRIFSATGAAMLKWWLPLNWAARIVQVEQKKGGHLPKEGKEIARGLIMVFDNLEHVADYSQRPMPKIALQAVQFVFWVSLVIGTLDNHHRNFDKKSGYRDAGYNPALLLLLDLLGHLDELIVYILFYAWIRMAEIVQNPFDGHKHYDIDVMREIDTSLYAATAALHF